MITAEQLQASYKANLETLLDLTNKAFEGVEKVVDLNLNASKAALTEVTEHSQAAVSAKDVQELMTLQANFLQPLAEKTSAYNRELYDITSAYSAECSKVYETQAAVLQKKFQELLNNTAKNTPPGSESVVAMVQSTVTAANDALESVQKAVKQATSVAENNFKTMTENASKVAATTASAGAKKVK